MTGDRPVVTPDAGVPEVAQDQRPSRLDRIRSLVGLTNRSLDANLTLGATIVRLEEDLAAAHRAAVLAAEQVQMLTDKTIGQAASMGHLQAENMRLTGALARAEARTAAPRAEPAAPAGTGHCSRDCRALARQAAADRANAVALANQLAQHEGRPVIGSLT